jgi:transposase
MLTDAQWAVLEPLIERCRAKGGRRSRGERRLVEACLWRLRNGRTWRAVPADVGPWQRAAELRLRWAVNGTWARLFTAPRDGGGPPLLDAVVLDGTVVRAHAKAAGAKGGARGPRSGARAAASARRRPSPATPPVAR